MSRWLLVLCLLASSGVHSFASAQGRGPLRRFGLFVGKNNGGLTRPTLRYAVSDARAMAMVLEQLGGLSPQDNVLLADPDLAALQRAVATQIERVRMAEASDARTELVFYYSGHSDQRGILLGDALLSYEVLKSWLAQVPADVRIVLLDSCSSGTLTRLKGGAHKPPFLFDESIAVRGHAILTASAEDEAAQESDRIGGSFFTHYLVSGLRGAADSSADGRVTLTEAYRFAFDETLARTGTTRAGAQHPSYEIQLAGSGDLVMTDLHETAATLEFGPDIVGHLYARDADERLVAELNKLPGTKVRLGFPRGRYTVLLERGDDRMQADVDLESRTLLRLDAGAFRGVGIELATARGAERRLVPVGAAFLPPYDTYRRAQRGEVESYLGLHALYGETDTLSGVQLGLGANGVAVRGEGVQIALIANRAQDFRGLQLAGAGNGARGKLTGLQLSGLGNLTRGTVHGLQAAFAYSGARELRGLQVASVNVLRARSYGLMAGGLNVARELGGVQVGGLNWARRLDGIQLSALNLADGVRGMQFGLVNIARGDVRGAQVGLINYANSTDAGIAPISITREGGVHAQLVSSEVAAFQAAVRFDARYTYSFFGGGIHPFANEPRSAYLFGGGFGGKVPVWGLLSAELDAGFYLVQPTLAWTSLASNMLAQLRGLVRIELHKYLSLLLGPSFNTLTQTDADHRVMPGLATKRKRATRQDAATEVYYWPGFVAGLRI